VHIAKNDIPTRIDSPGAVARQATDFGDLTREATLGAEYFSLAAGADIAPLLVGLDHDACQAPPWGYMVEGQVVVTYTDGTTETCSRNDLFHWPPGHSVRVIDDAEVVLFSPQVEHGAVMDHMQSVMAAMAG
jgi:hypothetical protein